MSVLRYRVPCILINIGYVKIVYNVGNIAETDLEMLIWSSYIVTKISFIGRIELRGAKYIGTFKTYVCTKKKIEVFIFDLHKHIRNILAFKNLI